ncbi:hypothetical protein ACIF8T_32035 [Streptomyces sp. NPDC085946]|uniref:hypothetical protein n=1 Tax=Streptomyces sp. NPDC085946 TaxID=3365744 RepID=UPI0037D94BF3
MIDDHAAAARERGLDDLFLRISHRFGRADLRHRMREYVKGLPALVGRNWSFQNEVRSRRKQMMLQASWSSPRWRSARIS